MMPELLLQVQHPVVTQFLSQCLAPHDRRMTIEAVLAHPVLEVDGLALEQPQAPADPVALLG